MRILHVASTLDPAAGGPPVVAARLAAAQAAQGHAVTILTYAPAAGGAASERGAGTSAPASPRALLEGIPGGADVRVALAHPRALEGLRGAGAAAAARPLVGESDVVHLHGVWYPIVRVAAREAKRAGIPYVLAPHGMLDPWSLSQKALKKRVALALAFRRVLDQASWLHMLNHDEVRLAAPLGLRSATEIVPNGIFPDEVAELPPRGRFRATVPGLGDAPFVLFLSRLHFKKGLDLLAEAFAILGRARPDVHLVVAGPDDGAQAELVAQVARLGVGSHVHLVGPLYAARKFEAFIDAEVFCLPSRQEGFSMAITEALASGRPVVITPECHFPDVESGRAGRIVPLEPARIAAALEGLLGDPEEAQAMGRRGRELVLSTYTWPAIAERTVALCRAHGARG
ncbi:MAG TPA: glycosyltransferase [Phycisphaerales bacterium]|nr:glycosyltransferase [Phycisphaerales bacterium]HMP38073.1 glycosyltransferase [Phycisphaerales bacterium]